MVMVKVKGVIVSAAAGPIIITSVRRVCLLKTNKKHLKNVGPIRDCEPEPSHVHSPGVATGTVARRLRIDVHDDNDNA